MASPPAKPPRNSIEQMQEEVEVLVRHAYYATRLADIAVIKAEVHLGIPQTGSRRQRIATQEARMHELKVELSAARAREQGQAWQAALPTPFLEALFGGTSRIARESIVDESLKRLESADRELTKAREAVQESEAALLKACQLASESAAREVEARSAYVQRARGWAQEDAMEVVRRALTGWREAARSADEATWEVFASRKAAETCFGLVPGGPWEYINVQAMRRDRLRATMAFEEALEAKGRVVDATSKAADCATDISWERSRPLAKFRRAAAAEATNRAYDALYRIQAIAESDLDDDDQWDDDDNWAPEE